MHVTYTKFFMKSKLIGRLSGPFSLSGEIRVQFIEHDLAKYLVKNRIELYSAADDRILTPLSCRTVAKGIAFKFTEITDRNQAEALSKGDLMANPADLPEINAESYMLEDLVGLDIYNQKNEKIAIIRHAYNFGASDIIDCVAVDNPSEKEFSVPMIEDIILEFNFEQNHLIVTDLFLEYMKLN